MNPWILRLFLRSLDKRDVVATNAPLASGNDPKHQDRVCPLLAYGQLTLSTTPWEHCFGTWNAFSPQNTTQTPPAHSPGGPRSQRVAARVRLVSGPQRCQRTSHMYGFVEQAKDLEGLNGKVEYKDRRIWIFMFLFSQKASPNQWSGKRQPSGLVSIDALSSLLLLVPSSRKRSSLSCEASCGRRWSCEGWYLMWQQRTQLFNTMAIPKVSLSFGKGSFLLSVLPSWNNKPPKGKTKFPVVYVRSAFQSAFSQPLQATGGQIRPSGPHEEVHIAQIRHQPAAHQKGTHGDPHRSFAHCCPLWARIRNESYQL